MVCSDCSASDVRSLKSDVEFLIHQFLRLMTTVGSAWCECPICAEKIASMTTSPSSHLLCPHNNNQKETGKESLPQPDRQTTTECSEAEISSLAYHHNGPLATGTAVISTTNSEPVSFTPDGDAVVTATVSMSRAQKRKARKYPVSRHPQVAEVNSDDHNELFSTEEPVETTTAAAEMSDSAHQSDLICYTFTPQGLKKVRIETPNVEVDENVYQVNGDDHNYSQLRQPFAHPPKVSPDSDGSGLLRHLLSTSPPPLADSRCLSNESSTGTGGELDPLRNGNSLANLTRIFCSSRRPPIKATICPLCDERINSNNKARHILNSHTDLRPYACEDCGKTFKDPSDCRKHVQKKHHHYPVKKLPPISEFVDMTAFDFREVDEDLLLSQSNCGSAHEEDDDENDVTILDDCV